MYKLIVIRDPGEGEKGKKRKRKSINTPGSHPSFATNLQRDRERWNTNYLNYFREGLIKNNIEIWTNIKSSFVQINRKNNCQKLFKLENKQTNKRGRKSVETSCDFLWIFLKFHFAKNCKETNKEANNKSQTWKIFQTWIQFTSRQLVSFRGIIGHYYYVVMPTKTKQTCVKSVN